MRILFVADGRSPIALDWIEYFIERGDEVHLASTFNNLPRLRFASFQFVPVAFSSLKSRSTGDTVTSNTKSKFVSGSAVQIRTVIRRWLAPLTLRTASLRLRQIIDEIRPDMVHAMRIPFEGILAARALESVADYPLVTSVWGNDFTLHAPSTPWMSMATRRALSRTNGLLADCQRDLTLAERWGFVQGKLTLLVPGNGGVKKNLFFQPDQSPTEYAYTAINPRGFRAYVRNDTFFKAIPSIVQRIPKVKFLCPDMSGDYQARLWVEKLGITENVELLPRLTRGEMAAVFRRSAIMISPTTYDGTPNTLLEGMACGCFPIAGDLETIREWITPGINGSLVDPANPQELAVAIIQAMENSDLRSTAADFNQHLVDERAEYYQNLRSAGDFYAALLT
jgi:Glycosyl transferases group 1/Glycosyl transferase 4-like